MAHTVVDVAHGEDESIYDAMGGLVADYPGLLAQLERPVGVDTPTGWPEVRVSGDADRLVAFLANFHDEHDGPWIRSLIHA